MITLVHSGNIALNTSSVASGGMLVQYAHLSFFVPIIQAKLQSANNYELPGNLYPFGSKCNAHLYISDLHIQHALCTLQMQFCSTVCFIYV